ncbi:hypothetical protein [Oceaniradius stylonematis]|nr:hypothetical protein [Oceaniradius stylonematis]
MRKTTALIAAVLLVAAAPVAHAEDSRIVFRYFSPAEYNEQLRDPDHDFTGHKLCVTGSWTLGNSGNPERLKDAATVLSQDVWYAIRNVRGLVCDFAAIRWDVEQYLPEIRKELDDWEMAEIVSLRGEP